MTYVTLRGDVLYFAKIDADGTVQRIFTSCGGKRRPKLKGCKIVDRRTEEIRECIEIGDILPVAKSYQNCLFIPMLYYLRSAVSFGDMTIVQSKWEPELIYVNNSVIDDITRNCNFLIGSYAKPEFRPLTDTMSNTELYFGANPEFGAISIVGNKYYNSWGELLYEDTKPHIMTTYADVSKNTTIELKKFATKFASLEDLCIFHALQYLICQTNILELADMGSIDDINGHYCYSIVIKMARDAYYSIMSSNVSEHSNLCLSDSSNSEIKS